MDTDELGFNTWILVGNVLHALLRGASPIGHGSGRERLQRLDTLLDPVKPPHLLETLQNLPADDQRLLLEACIAAQIAAGGEVEARLGLNYHDAAAVLAVLQQPTSSQQDKGLATE